MGSHSKIGLPTLALRDAFGPPVKVESLTAQLVIIALSSLNGEEYRAVQQEIDHYTLPRISQNMQELWPWTLLEDGHSLIKVKAV